MPQVQNKSKEGLTIKIDSYKELVWCAAGKLLAQAQKIGVHQKTLSVLAKHQCVSVFVDPNYSIPYVHL